MRSVSDAPLDREYFIKALKKVKNPTCETLTLHEELLEVAIKKDGENRNKADKNLIFPPRIVEALLSRKKVQDVLQCRCKICSAAGRTRSLLSDDVLIGAITKKDGGDQRQLFAVLVFMGAGFAARHLSAFNIHGLDRSVAEQHLQSQLFDNLESIRVDGSTTPLEIFPDTMPHVTSIFWEIFMKALNIFNCPILTMANAVTNYTGRNLPFLNKTPLGISSAFGSLFAFEVPREFREDRIPSKLVRKELKHNAISEEECQTLEFFARCEHPNLIQLLFWYLDDDKINYVFPHYPGNLEGLLDETLKCITFKDPEKYGNKLNHALWQGMVDVMAALAFFHFPKQNILPGKLTAAHFDMKPANILITSDGKLVVTDFGQSRLKALSEYRMTSFTSSGGDPNYRPPPLPPKIADDDKTLRWSQAYDVWSMACIVTETIEYILNPEPGSFRSFQNRRRQDDKSSAAFWMQRENHYELRPSVRKVLQKFKNIPDQYLNMVVEHLDLMFAIDPLERPTISECLQVISVEIPTDEWPLKDDDEQSVCGLETNPQLRNMHTKFKRRSDKARSCKMYLLLNKTEKSLRLCIEYEKPVEGQQTSMMTCVVSESAQCKEEEFRLTSLFEEDYEPVLGVGLSCSFNVIHRNITFVFDDPRLALKAVTRQRSISAPTYIPLESCTLIKRSGIATTRKEVCKGGHLQIWQQLSENAYRDQFIFSPHFRKRSTGTIGQDLPILQNTSTANSLKLDNESDTHRLLMFFPKNSTQHSRCISVNLTNGFNHGRLGVDYKNRRSRNHMTFYASNANFYVADFQTDKSCPGIPVDPEKFATHEALPLGKRVDWVELKFENERTTEKFVELWRKLFPKDNIPEWVQRQP